MLTLERPFAGASAWSVLRQVVAGQLIPPSQRKPEREVPFELEAVVLKAMAPSPRDRYDTVDQMKQEIEAYLEGRLLQAAEYSTWQVLKKWGARHQAAAAAAAGILLSMIVAFGVIIWQLGVVQEERDKANKRELQAQLASKQAQASEQAALEAVEEKNREARRREATDLVRKAMELYTRKGDRDKVIAYLTEAAQSVPHHPGLLRLRGRMALDQEKWPQAKELLERALRQDASDYLTHFLLYRWYAQQEQGNTSAAQTHVIAASKYGTRDSAIGLWAHGTREWGKAEKLSGSEKTKALGRCVDLCTQALAKQSDFVWALMFRGYSYKELERWNKALADHKAVIELTSGSAMAYYNRGRLYTKMKRCQEALADFSTAIGVDPLYAGAYINRGDLHRRRKWYAKALADFDEAIRLAPRDAEGYSNRGLLHKEMKWYAKALADLDNAIRIAPRSARAYTNRGNLYRSIKEHAKALADFSQAIRIDPQLAKAHFNRGTLHQAMKRYDQALADFDQAIRLAPRDAEGYNNRGNLHRLMKRYDKALADYAKVIRIDPRHARAYFNRGNLYQSLKQPAQAIADYGHAIRIDPRHAQAFNYRGFLLYRQGRYRLAVADWQRALSLLRGTAWEDKLIQYIRQARSRIK